MKLLTVFNTKYFYQLLATGIIIFLNTSHGIGMGWLSPALLYLQSPEKSPPFLITIEQLSWIGSLYGLGSLFGNIFFGILINRIGRKWCLCLLAIPHMSAWILIYFSKSFGYLYAARFLFGTTAGGNDFITPLYISEIADSSIRGMLSTTTYLFTSIGILLGFILSSHLNYYLNPCIIIVLSIVFLLAASTQLPETPQYLLKKHQTEKAEKSYNFYKNIKNADQTEMPNAAKENQGFEELKNDICQMHNAEKVSLKDFANKEVAKVFVTALVLIFLHEFSGAFSFLNYMSTIFAQSGIDMDPNTCTIIIGGVVILGCCCTILMIDHFGRKFLMLLSTAGMALGELCFGFYVRFASTEFKAHYNWLPLIIMIFIVLIASTGVAYLVFFIIVEIMPCKIRSIGSPICMMFLSAMVFASLKLVPLILEEYGLDILMFFSGGVCIFCWIYMFLFLKETKGQNLDK